MNMNIKKYISRILQKPPLWGGLVGLLLLTACREDVEIFESETVVVSVPEYTSIQGFYLLNEGNMGSNKSTLDYYDYTEGEYHRNIFGAANPSVVKELGDVGNDVKIYGSKLYAVINCSNKVEVMDAKTAKRLGQIDIPNCRYIRFQGAYAYITSYAGPVEINPDYRQRGFVAKVDTATYEVIDRCLVGYQPDEMEIAGNKIYVTNSGGYMSPNYENTVSVIDIPTFTETERIEVAINLHRLRLDRHGHLWVTSRGDYYGHPSRLYCIDLAASVETGRAPSLHIDSLDMAVSNFHLDGDSLYVIGTSWNYQSMSDEITYGIVDVAKKELVSRSFISDGTDKDIQTPYGIMVNPLTKEIYVTDAKNKVLPGMLYCFDKDGKQKWQVRTGDIPAHFVFLGEMSEP
jgi:DNA-binding beta-propeller fold protein YncE